MDYQVFYPILDLYGGPLLLALFVLLLLAEYRWSLRRWVQGILRRLMTNVAVAVPTLLVMRLALIPLVVAAGYWARENQFGLLYLIPLPGGGGDGCTGCWRFCFWTTRSTCGTC